MEVKCNFEIGELGECKAAYYTGFVSSIKNPGTSVSVFKGIHQESKTNRDVEGLSFFGKKVEQFPRGIQNFFPILTCLQIADCGLKKIARRDLLGLENLKFLFLNQNKLKALPDNLFKNMSKLEELDFSGNKITRMSSNLFKPLNKEILNLADFRGIPSIDYRYKSDDGETSLDVLLRKIDESCELSEERSTDKKYREKYHLLMKSSEELYVN